MFISVSSAGTCVRQRSQEVVSDSCVIKSDFSHKLFLMLVYGQNNNQCMCGYFPRTDLIYTNLNYQHVAVSLKIVMAKLTICCCSNHFNLCLMTCTEATILISDTSDSRDDKM